MGYLASDWNVFRQLDSDQLDYFYPNHVHFRCDIASYFEIIIFLDAG